MGRGHRTSGVRRERPQTAARGQGERGRVGGRIIVGTPKTHETRSVPYPASLSALIAEQCEGKRPDDLLFGTGYAHMVAPKSGKGWFWAAVQRARAIDPTCPS